MTVELFKPQTETTYFEIVKDLKCHDGILNRTGIQMIEKMEHLKKFEGAWQEKLHLLEELKIRILNSSVIQYSNNPG